MGERAYLDEQLCAHAYACVNGVHITHPRQIRHGDEEILGEFPTVQTLVDSKVNKIHWCGWGCSEAPQHGTHGDGRQEHDSRLRSQHNASAAAVEAMCLP